jgi:hypothetical protein
MTRLGEEVEGLRLDIGVIQRRPLQILLGQLAVGRFAGLLSHGLDGIRAVDGLLCAGNGRQTGRLSEAIPSCSAGTEGCTHVDLAQLNILRPGRRTIQESA